MRVWAAPIKIFRYNNLSGANSHAVCVLAHSLKNRRQPFIKEIINFQFNNEWLSCCYRTFKGIRRCVQAAKQQAVWLSSDCINGKYLWALPTPTTFEKVDQTFIIDWQINLLNHNLLHKADNFCEVISSYFIYKQTAIKNSTHI